MYCLTKLNRGPGRIEILKFYLLPLCEGYGIFYLLSMYCYHVLQDKAFFWVRSSNNTKVLHQLITDKSCHIHSPNRISAEKIVHIVLCYGRLVKLADFSLSQEFDWGRSLRSLRQWRTRCQYETPLIENIPAVYNSPCMCYPLYNILLNKILLLGKWVWFPLCL